MDAHAIRTSLAERGQRRAEALAAAHAELQAIGELLPAAEAAGISLSEIARITGVTRPTLYQLRGSSPRPG